MRISVILVCLVAVSLVRADIGPTPGSEAIAPVFAAADLVCNCFVKSVAVVEERIDVAGKPAVRRYITATTEIRDSFKTDGIEDHVVLLRYVREEQHGMRIAGARQAILEGQTALMFLTRTGPGIYSFADPFLGATAFQSLPQQLGGAGLLKLQHVLAAVAAASDRTDRIRALRLLQGFDRFDQESLSRVSALSNSADPEVALPALGVLLKTKTSESVVSLRNYLDAYAGDGEPIALVSVGTELGEINDEKALPAIEALSHSRYLSIRFGAMDAMRRMKNPKSAVTLIARLDDADATVQYLAVITLAETFGKSEPDFAPTMNLFDEKPQYYVQVWKSWWNQNGGSVQ